MADAHMRFGRGDGAHPFFPGEHWITWSLPKPLAGMTTTFSGG